VNDKERQLLSGFLNNLTQARVDNRDAEADAMIREAVARQPDAAYLLVQQALLQQAALSRTQSQANGAASSSGQRADSAPPGRGGWSNPARAAAAQAPMGRQAAGGGAGDFLRSAAATAVGVAGGAMLFQGLQDLFSGDGTASGEDSGFLGGAAPIDDGAEAADSSAPSEDAAISGAGLDEQPPLDAGDGFDDGEGGLFGGLDPFGDDDADWG
jgi:hypothetical protein